jgi:cytidylate kinase
MQKWTARQDRQAAGVGRHDRSEKEATMPKPIKSIDQILDQQIQKWNLESQRQARAAAARPPLTVTVSRDVGCRGEQLARRLAQELRYDIFDQELIQQVADSAHISASVVATVDEKWRSVMEDWIAGWADHRSLWLDDYLKHLVKVVGAIGRHGRAVIVGRGANFILGRQKEFNVWRIRLIAPPERRAEALAQERRMAFEDALKFVARADAERQAFIRKYFNADINDPLNYDMVLNVENITVEEGTALLKAAIVQREAMP